MTGDLDPSAVAIIAELRALRGTEQEGLSQAQQSDLWVKLGIACFSILIIGGFGLLYSGDQESNDKIDKLTESVTELVAITGQQQAELAKRGQWMSSVDTYSEQSRLYDQRHEQQIEDLDRRVTRIEGSDPR